MELDLNKVIYYKNKEKAEIGKEYYFLNCLDEEDILCPKRLERSRDILYEIRDEKTLCFGVDNIGWVGTFLYPVE